MGVREAAVEKKLNDEVEKLGGITRKWVSPGRDGVPDRIVVHRGKVYFVEVKTTDGKLSMRQKREIKMLTSRGADVRVINGDAEVYRFIAELTNG